MLENALAQFWEHTDRWVRGREARRADGSLVSKPQPLHLPPPMSFKPAAVCRLEKCASLLSRKDLAAVKRRYQQLEVRRVEERSAAMAAGSH